MTSLSRGLGGSAAACARSRSKTDRRRPSLHNSPAASSIATICRSTAGGLCSTTSRPDPAVSASMKSRPAGGGLRQITFPPEDEQTRIRTYSLCSWDELSGSRIATVIGPTTCTPATCPTAASCSPPRGASGACSCGGHELTVTNLYRVDADGTGLVQLSQGALSQLARQ